ncbi:ABC transporter substrate-binding protein [Chloroflexi bacterium TSY]|nr:ABC transporter substrate-binding protein [Chloroflexi bacterium TSY]
MLRQKSRLHVAIAFFVALVLVLTACTPTAPAPSSDEGSSDATMSDEDALRSKTVIFDISSGQVTSPELWNPYVPGGRRDMGWHQLMLEPLFLSNLLTGEIEPWLADNMTPNETLDVWTLTLNPGAKWSDGEAFDADDVVYSVNLALENAEIGDWGLRTWVESVEKIDAQTVVFNLLKPNPRFQMDHFAVKIWGSFAIVPEHIWKDQDPLTFTFYDPEQGWPVYTGPYKVAEVSPTEFIYERDDNWWGAAAGFKDLRAPERVIWTWRGPEEVRTLAMVDNQLDGLHDISPGAYEALKAQNPNVIAWTEELPYAHIEPTCTRTLEFNTTVAPWDNPRMRWAINHAIDRDEIVSIAYEGATVKSRSFFPISAPLERLVDKLEEAGLYEQYPLTVYDPELTKQILEEEGYTREGDGYYQKDGEELTLQIIVHESFIEKLRWTQVVVEQLQRIGINAITTALAGGTWGDKINFGDFEASGGWQTCGSTSEPWSSLDNFNAKWVVPVGERSTKNIWRWDNAEFSALVDEMGVLPVDDPKVEELFIEAMEIWMAALPVIPTTQARKLTPFNTTYWTGWPTAENPYTSPTDWWQNTHAIIHNLESAQ